MSEMSSFYGGRQGNSIVIAKRFDGIDIPQVAGSYVYTRGLYAVDSNGDFIITQDTTISGIVGVGIVSSSGEYSYSTTDFLIKKNKDNYLGTGITGFGGWGGHDNDATQINATSYVFYPVQAQGMVQFFAEGAKTASEVNYGAYVIIDTILNMVSLNDPDNGKVYRRGMDINSTDGLAGAEYIGQIVGPQGEAPEFDIETYDIVSALDPHREEAYNAANNAIAPGSYTVGTTRFYEDEIKYAWATIRDAFGNVTGCELGFKFPTLVEDYEARSLSPYEQRAVGGDGKYYNYDLIKEDETQYYDMTKSCALNSSNQFVLGTATDTGAYKVEATEGTIYLIEYTDKTKSEYLSWQSITFDGSSTITAADGNTYTMPEIKKWAHPFYQKWQISVPHGYHGVNPEDIEIIHTYTMTPEMKADYSSGIAVPGTIEVYDDADCTTLYTTITDASTVKTYPIYGTAYKYINDINDLDADDTDARTHVDKVSGKYYMRDGGAYDASPDVISCRIYIDNTYKYVKKSDCYMDIIRYRERDFDDKEEGIARYFYLGDYDTISRVTISDDGTLTVFYNTQAQPKELEQILRWIDTKETDGITIDEDGTVHVYYNTVHDPDPTDPYQKLDTLGRAHDHQDYPNVLDWITEASLTARGKFTILYNNNTMIIGHDAAGDPIYGNKYETTLQWIDYIEFDDDGTITFRWNTDGIHNTPPVPDPIPAYQFSNKIKYLYDVQVENTKTDASDPRMDGYEGTGDQKIHIQYNNDGHIDRPIGVPLNYIIETCICTPTTSYPDAPYSHLLVYYADPALRKTFQSKWVTYPSGKIIDSYIPDPADPTQQIPVYHVWTEWVDLGNARGAAGGIHIIKNVSSLNDLKDSSGNFIPPEKLTDSSGTVINPDGAGWACSMDTTGSTTAKDILFYDYETEEWYSIGSIDASSVDPSYIIVKSKPDSSQMPYAADVSQLKANGFWLASETGVYAF